MTDIDEIEALLEAKLAEYTDVDARLAFLALAALAHRVLAEHPDARYVDATYTEEPGTPCLVFDRVTDGTTTLCDDWDDEAGDGYLLCAGNRARWEYFCTRVDNRREEFIFDLHACRGEALAAAHREEKYST